MVLEAMSKPAPENTVPFQRRVTSKHSSYRETFGPLNPAYGANTYLASLNHSALKIKRGSHAITGFGDVNYRLVVVQMTAARAQISD
jgi:hypothetical protein